MIDSKDEVFSKLLLWHDLNENGLSESDELVDLESSGVVALDLDYISLIEPNDRFGNESRQKSVVLMADDTLRTVFDIWFAPGLTKAD